MITYEEVAELLDYNPDTGELRWKESRGCIKAGDIAGCTKPNGQVVVRINNHLYRAHRLAWLLYYQRWPKNQIDHIDHNPSNNKLNNIREVTASENLRNQSLSIRNKSGVCGVGWHKKRRKWVAEVKLEQKTRHLGYFDNLEEAATARAEANKRYNFHDNHGKAL